MVLKLGGGSEDEAVGRARTLVIKLVNSKPGGKHGHNDAVHRLL